LQSGTLTIKEKYLQSKGRFALLKNSANSANGANGRIAKLLTAEW